MVTSNKLPDRRVVKMAEQNNSVVVPQRTLLGDINVHITCPICRGYYIDATTIVECLHSFCRSCIIKHLELNRNNSYCPVCEMMINPSKPNIKLDKALQDIVYKLVPGLFQKEMERRQKFYASRPGPAATATPEQRGEDTERIIFSPEDVISFSLEYADVTDTDSISSKSSDSNEPQLSPTIARRYLQCPAVVNISHLKKFLCMKFDIDSTQFAIDILYKRVPLPDYYTLMDIAYIYNWKRNEPMRFFYQIIDYVAIRNRLFDINRKGPKFHGRKSSPHFDDASSPAPNLNDQGSEASSGTDSPMPDDSSKQKNNYKNSDKSEQLQKPNDVQVKKEDEVEKSQFLNSFELTAKSSGNSTKSSPVKPESATNVNVQNTIKADDNLKRKSQTQLGSEPKKLKVELEKIQTMNLIGSSASLTAGTPTLTTSTSKSYNVSEKLKEFEGSKQPQVLLASKTLTPVSTSSVATTAPISTPVKENKSLLSLTKPTSAVLGVDSQGVTKPVPVPHSVSPKHKPQETSSVQLPNTHKSTHSPLKPPDVQKALVKKIPDLKPGIPGSMQTQYKGPPVNKVRMDLLANNCDPTMDRSKILSQVKVQGPVQTSGDPLKSLFDQCKLNIPSSLSITLTDQKLDPRNLSEPSSTDPKKPVVNKNLAAANNGSTHKVPSPPVHNYIEILKLPDNDPKKQMKPDVNAVELKSGSPATSSLPTQPKMPSKSSESSGKGPIPNLKPISDTKLGKAASSVSSSSSSPITFQQTFEQQLQSLQSDKKPKLPKPKGQVPKLLAATPKTFSAVSKLNKLVVSPTTTTSETKPSTALDLSSPQPKLPKSVGQVPMLVPATSKSFSSASKTGSSDSKSSPGGSTLHPENKPSTALDLSTPHNLPTPSQLCLSKAFETMQTIANLAKNLPSKLAQPNISQSFSGRPLGAGMLPMRLPNMSNINSNQNPLRQTKPFRIPGPNNWPH